MTARIDFEALNVLLQAPSKSFVDTLLTRSMLGPNETLYDATAEALSISRVEASRTVQALRSLASAVTYDCLSSRELVEALFPVGFHDALKTLLAGLLVKHTSTWTKMAIDAKVTNVPTLGDISATPGAALGYADKSLLVDLTMQPPGVSGDAVPGLDVLRVLLAPDQVAQLRGDLAKIKDQLSTMM